MLCQAPCVNVSTLNVAAAGVGPPPVSGADVGARRLCNARLRRHPTRRFWFLQRRLLTLVGQCGGIEVNRPQRQARGTQPETCRRGAVCADQALLADETPVAAFRARRRTRSAAMARWKGRSHGPIQRHVTGVIGLPAATRPAARLRPLSRGTERRRRQAPGREIPSEGGPKSATSQTSSERLYSRRTWRAVSLNCGISTYSI
jgi:hypothetical protein